MRKLAMVMAGCLLAFAHDARADFYSWVDRDGNQFYTNDPARIPPEYRSRAAQVEPDAGRVNLGGASPGATGPRAAEHKDKYGRGERWWRERASKLRLKLHDLRLEYDLVLKQERDWQAKQKSITTGKKASAASPYARRKSRLELQISKHRRMLEVELPDEARRAGAYPGWIRE